MGIVYLTHAVLQHVRLIEDIIGTLPSRYFNLLLKDKLTRTDRFKICVFCYVNGLNIDLFLELRQIAHDHTQEAQKYYSYITSFDRNENYRRRYYSYNVSCKEWQYLNGHVCPF